MTRKLKEYIRTKYDIDLVGVAAADALNGEPEGHRPQDILPGAKSILVFGRGLADGAVAGDLRALETGFKNPQSAYSAYGSELAPNYLLVNDSFRIAAHIEDTYHAVAVPMPFHTQQSMLWENVPAPFFTDPYKQGMPINIFQAALAAGLGEYGWSSRFLTPEFGPRVMLSAVLTTLELEPDPLYAGEPLCDHKNCGVCAKLCPTGAISTEESRTLGVEGKTCEAACLKANNCAVASMAFRKEFQGRVPVPDLIMKNDPTDEELRAAFEKKPVNGLTVDHYPRYFCDRCLLYCPVGRWKERFYDTGMSGFNQDTKCFEKMKK